MAEGDDTPPTLKVILTTMTGHIESWEQLVEICENRTEPIYLAVITSTKNSMLQFKNPKENLLFTDKAMHYVPTLETTAQRQFFNRDFVPTFFVFDNYMHYHGLKARLKGIGASVAEEKFE